MVAARVVVLQKTAMTMHGLNGLAGFATRTISLADGKGMRMVKTPCCVPIGRHLSITHDSLVIEQWLEVSDVGPSRTTGPRADPGRSIQGSESQQVRGACWKMTIGI
jgi:hypothetical protein